MNKNAPATSMTSFQRVHIVGIGGWVLSGLAELLHYWGKTVSGAELESNSRTERLAGLGIPCAVGTREAGISPHTDCLVVSPRMARTHPDIVRAKHWGLPIFTAAQMLGYISERKRTIAVAGCHGKTTVAAFIGTVLVQAERDPSVLLRSPVEIWGSNCRAGHGEEMVMEADENERRFLALSPAVGVIMNIEADHLDYYEDMDMVMRAYHQFARRVCARGTLIANRDDERIVQALKGVRGDIVWFGRSDGAAVRALDPVQKGGALSFLLHIRRGEEDIHFDLAVPGQYQIANALAVAAVCHHLHIPLEFARAALAAYHGGQRHMEILGEREGVIVVDDAADHPSEIISVLHALRMQYPEKKIWCVFQPYLERRMKYLQDEFARSFTDADRVCILPVIKGVEEGGVESSSQDLADVATQYHPFVSRTPPAFSELPPHSILVTLGADQVREVGKNFLK